MKRGFTLIELLVVVLIIGILAAVALPQYEKAVKKARMVEVLSYLRAYEQGEEAYFLANGSYADAPEYLDISMPVSAGAISNADKGYFILPEKGIWFAVIGDITKPDHYYVQGGLGHLKEGAGGSLGYGDIESDLTYTVYLLHSTKPGQRTCSGRTKEYQNLCNALIY